MDADPKPWGEVRREKERGRIMQDGGRRRADLWHHHLN